MGDSRAARKGILTLGNSLGSTSSSGGLHHTCFFLDIFHVACYFLLFCWNVQQFQDMTKQLTGDESQLVVKSSMCVDRMVGSGCLA